LSKLLSCLEVMSELSQCHESDDEFSYDVCDGKFVKSHPLYEGDRNFLKFMSFCDELVLDLLDANVEHATVVQLRS